MSSKVVNCYTLFTDSKNEQFLIEGTNDGFVIIRRFPDLKIKIFIQIFLEEKIPIRFVKVLKNKKILVCGHNQKEFQVVSFKKLKK